MLELWAVLTPILLVDLVNPVLFALMVYAAGTDRPLSNAIAVLFGHTAAYLVFGILLGFTFETIAERMRNPKSIDFAISLVVGALLVWAAWRSRRADGARNNGQEEMGQLTPVKAFGTGAIINIIGLPFALPYFAALDQILKADLTTTGSLAVLAGYNLGYALPFLIVPALTLILGEGSRQVLQQVNAKVDRASRVIMPLMLAAVGIALLVDGILYFARGEGLF